MPVIERGFAWAGLGWGGTPAEAGALGFALGLLVAALGLAAWMRRPRAARAAVESAALEGLQDRIWRSAECEDRYRALVEATTEVIVERDAGGRITFASDAFARLLGAEPLALVGTAASPETVERGPVAHGPGGVRRFEERIVPVDGVPRWFAFVETAVVGPGGATRWLRAGTDVTERVEAARALDGARGRAEAASVAKSRFLATVSHEFRTPLNGILGMAELALGTDLDPEQRTYVEAVRTSGRALLTLIDGILDFSRIEAGRLDLAAEPFDLAALVEGVVELIAPRAQDKGLELAADVADDLPGRVVGDPERVRQILLNLAGNAVKFTARGGVGVTVTREADGIALAVEDTGPGISEERLPRLFEEFEQGDDPAGRQEGTGLGLAITRRLVAGMNGRIEARSTPGRGSTFRVVLPLPAGSAPDDREAVPRLGGRRVLIVADSPFQAPYLARRLARAGAATVAVASVENGRAALAGGRFDAVIADHGLGDCVRGLAAEARAMGVRCSLILLSPFDRRAFGAAGFDGYLIKPVRTRSLFDRLLEPAGSAGMLGPAPEREEATGRDSVPRAQLRRRARVLVAEDDPINALLARRALERLGAAVILARDGAEALAHLDEVARGAEGFDLALLDIRMPGIDGLETARRIRAGEAERGGTPLHLVALTADAGPAAERAARAAGFDALLAKPLDLRAFPALLERPAAAA